MGGSTKNGELFSYALTPICKKKLMVSSHSTTSSRYYACNNPCTIIIRS